MTTTNTTLRSNPAPSTSETEGTAEVTELASESVQQLLPEALVRYYPTHHRTGRAPRTEKDSRMSAAQKKVNHTNVIDLITL